MTQEERWVFEEKYNSDTSSIESDAFRFDCERLQNGEPVAYVIGYMFFLGKKIYLDSKPFIPRNETEFWVDSVLVEMGAKSDSQIIDVLELCSGSGCISVAIASHIPNTVIDCVEIDTAHHATIRKNIEANGINPVRVNVLQGDLFQTIPPLSKKYDYILTNPPYIATIKNQLQDSVIKYEPHLALFGGKTGMDLIEEIIAKAPSYLNANGILYIEHDPEQSSAIAQCAQQHGFACVTRGDQYKFSRYSRLHMAQ